MKKILLVTLFLSIAFCQIPISIQYAKSEAGQFSFPKEYRNIDLKFFYFEDNSDIKIKYNEYSLIIDYVNKEKLIRSFLKYEEWNDKAMKSDVELQKEIYPEDQIKISLSGPDLDCLDIDKYDKTNSFDDAAYSRIITGERTIRTIFLSQHSKNHQIVLKFSDYGDTTCKFMGYDQSLIFKFFLDFDQAIEFKNIISQDYINSKKVVFN